MRAVSIVAVAQAVNTKHITSVARAEGCAWAISATRLIAAAIAVGAFRSRCERQVQTSRAHPLLLGS